MKIIISPAKKMKEDTDFLLASSVPVFSEKAQTLWNYMRSLSCGELQTLLACGDRLARLNFTRCQQTDSVISGKTPAVFAYEGIQYQYMAPQIFSDSAFSYLRETLRILSGLYGILRPFDAVIPYRLEMRAKPEFCKNLYRFWGDTLYRELTKEDTMILNLASAEYSKTIQPYLTPSVTYVTCIFGEWTAGKVREKGVYVKMARGEMVRYMAEREIQDIRDIRSFDCLGYRYCEDLSTDTQYVFLK